MPGSFDAASDSTFFTYVAAAAADGSSASLYGSLADGTEGSALVTGIVTSNLAGNCLPKVAFAGSYVVVASCAAGSFGAAGPPRVSSFDSARGWAASLLVPSAIDQIAVDPDGANVLAATSTGTLEYIPIGGGAPVIVDEGNVVRTTPTSTSTLFIAPNPTRAIYQAGSNGLRVATLPSGPASVLGAGSVGVVFGLSSDGNYASFATPAQDLTSGYPLDLSIVSTMPGGVVVPLEQGNPAAVFYNLYNPDSFNGTEFTIGTPYPFTADSAYALFTMVPAGSGDDTPPGSLQATPVSGAAGMTVAGASVYAAVPLTGSRVLWNDGYVANGNALGGPVASLRVVDVSTNGPTLILAGADADFAVSPDGTRAVYSLNYGVATDGIYVVAIP